MPKPTNNHYTAAFAWWKTFGVFLLCWLLPPHITLAQTEYAPFVIQPGQSHGNNAYILRQIGEKTNPVGFEIVRRVNTKTVIAYPTALQARETPDWQILGQANDLWKVSSSVNLITQTHQQTILLTVRNWQKAMQALEQSGITITKKLQAGNTLVVRCSTKQLREELLPDPNIIYIDQSDSPIQEEAKITGQDLSVNRINYLHSKAPNLQGEGFTILIKEGGFNPTDLDIFGRVTTTGIEHPSITQHATSMATIAGGAGNSSLEGVGVARRATLGSIEADTPVLPEPFAFYERLSAYVQNHSFGTEIRNEYNSEAHAFDAFLHKNPQIMMVFSSGNSGSGNGTQGTYANLPGFANLTAPFKHSKNVLVVGGVDTTYQVPSFASRGPAYDGRVKPEIVAYSPNGTSDASATVAGLSVLLQETLKQQLGTLPSAALIKAALINTADDVGLPGLDYFSGYGSVNAYRAWHSLQNVSYEVDTLISGQASQHEISVPAGAAELRVAIVWNDPTANPGDFKALVNDLNLTVTSPSRERFLPWVLNPTPNTSTLSEPAQRKVDTLNNLEQITLTNPSAGAYQITVKCNDCTSDQPFALHYWIDTEPTVRWTHPMRTDGFITNNTYFLRWDAAPNAGTAQLQVKYNAQDWETLRTHLPLKREYWRWEAPDSVTEVQFRLVTEEETFTSDQTRVHPNFRPSVALRCADSVIIDWQSDPNALEYTVYKLGAQYMEPWFNTTDTSFIFKLKSQHGVHFAVQPRIGKSYQDLRTPTIDYTLQGGLCYFQTSFAKLFPKEERAEVTFTLSTTQGVKEISFFRIHEGTSSLLASQTSNFGDSLIISDLEVPEGTVKYVARLTTNNGASLTSDTARVFYVAPGELRIFPNPTHTFSGFTVTNNLPETATLQLLSLQGQLVLETSLDTYRNFVNTFHLNPGIYIYYVRTSKKVFSGKIILQ